MLGIEPISYDLREMKIKSKFDERSILGQSASFDCSYEKISNLSAFSIKLNNLI